MFVKVFYEHADKLEEEVSKWIDRMEDSECVVKLLSVTQSGLGELITMVVFYDMVEATPGTA